MNETPHVNLIIATPGHSMMSIYVRSLLAATEELNKRGISWAFSSEYASHVADAREMTLNGDNRNDLSESRPFKGSITYDKVLWIDSDIAFSPQDVVKAYESPYDIVTGAYLLASGEATLYRKLFGPALVYDEVLKMTEPEKIFGAGMGFMAVKSGVFESLSRPWFQSPTVTVDHEGKDYTFPIMGEDLSFCYRAAEAGFEVWFDPSIKLQHHKVMKLTWEGIKP